MPANIPQSGFEAEFERLRQKIAWNLPFLTARWRKCYDQIAISPWESLGEFPPKDGNLGSSCSGLAQFTHAGAYDGIDKTSFRGEFVVVCPDLINEEIRQRAYSPFTATEAMNYGEALYQRASEFAMSHGLDPATAKGDADEDPRDSIEGQIEVFRSASEWFGFWGQKGHGVRPWA